MNFNKTLLYINSRNNPKLKELLSRKEEFFFFEGDKLVSDLLAQGQKIEYLMLHENVGDSWQPPQNATIMETWVVSDQVFSKLSSLKNPPMMMALVPLHQRPVDFSSSSLIFGFHHLQDPGNAGTIFRCAAAFGVVGIVFTGESVKFNNNKFLRATQNALFAVNYQYMETLDQLIEAAEKAQMNIYVTTSHPGAQPVQPDRIQRPCLILLGNEGKGLDESLFQRFPSITIPQTNAVDSLNVGISACIIMSRIFSA